MTVHSEERFSFSQVT